jgi:hypothetical protein
MNLFGQIDKKTIAAALGMLVILAAYLFYAQSKSSPSDGEITSVPVSPLDAKLGRELLAALAKLKSTKLDRTIFDDPVFLSLKDFGVEIPSEPIGRRNPFAAFEETMSTKAKTGKPAAPKTPPGKPAPAKPPPGDGFDLE